MKRSKAMSDLVVPEGAKSLGINLDALGVGSEAMPQARYTKSGDDGMNRLERRYDKHLAYRKVSGEIADYAFQAMKLLIIDPVPKSDDAIEGVRSSWYTPDFVVYENDGSIAFHETKGFKDEAGDGWLKFKAAASRHPFPFYFVQWVKGEWDIKRYGR